MGREFNPIWTKPCGTPTRRWIFFPWNCGKNGSRRLHSTQLLAAMVPRKQVCQKIGIQTNLGHWKTSWVFVVHFLSPSNAWCLQWCRVRAHWKAEWNSVEFIDQSRFCLGISDGRTRVRRRPGEHLLLSYIRHRYIDPIPGIMVWGGISYDSKTHLVIIGDHGGDYIRMVIPLYCHLWILQGACSNKITLVPISQANVLFEVLACFSGRWDRQIFRPSNMWDIIGRQLRADPYPATTIADLTV